ncbi:MAG: hypothetical protein C5B52_10980 [Bacteroidetes bacterium]|nr:MAG: hypothetical protein C5B52_10980 [Bacteroidota bacterium]
MSTALKSIADSIKHWYIPLIIGIVLIFVGIDVFSTPVASYVALSVIFSVSFLVSGILQIIFAVSNRKELPSWGWHLAGGILYTLVGLQLVSRPEISMATLPFIVGFYILFQSSNALGWAFELRNMGVSSWGTIALISVLGILFSFILIWNPAFAGMTLVTWTGLAFILVGISGIMLGLGLRRIKNLPAKISDEIKTRVEAAKL